MGNQLTTIANSQELHLQELGSDITLEDSLGNGRLLK
jgi:hypothetical protein